MATVRDEYGMICPNCGRDDALRVEISTMAALSADGTDADAEAHEWNGASRCACKACDWHGLASEAMEAAEGAPPVKRACGQCEGNGVIGGGFGGDGPNEECPVCDGGGVLKA